MLPSILAMPPYVGLKPICKVNFIKCTRLAHPTSYLHVSKQKDLETRRFAHFPTVQAVGQEASNSFGM